MLISEKNQLIEKLEKLKVKLDNHAFNCEISMDVVRHLDDSVMSLIQAIEELKKGK